MKFKATKSEGKRFLTADDCQETTEMLMQYRRKGIPLMPHQIEYLKKNGFRLES